MKKVMSILMVAAFGFVCASSAMAGRIKNRQVHQQKRIHKGIHSGELTCQEVKALEKEQRHVQKTKKKVWSDGKLTPGERIRLERQQDKAGKHIYKLKHNGRTR